MAKSELEAVQYAIQILEGLIPEKEPPDVARISRSSVYRFAETLLSAAPSGEMSCAELWSFFSEAVAARMLPPMQKTTFFRELPAVMKMIYGIKKCHNVRRGVKTVRGFKGVGVRDSD
jgi:hypothetical protein